MTEELKKSIGELITQFENENNITCWDDFYGNDKASEMVHFIAVKLIEEGWIRK